MRKTTEDKDRLNILKVERQNLLKEKKNIINSIKSNLIERHNILNKYKKA